jgi:hypothetical protein
MYVVLRLVFNLLLHRSDAPMLGLYIFVGDGMNPALSAKFSNSPQ